MGSCGGTAGAAVDGSGRDVGKLHCHLHHHFLVVLACPVLVTVVVATLE